MLLGRISEELSDLAIVAATLEETVGQITERSAEVPAEVLRKLQALDLLRQSIEDLAAVTRCAAGGASDAAAVQSAVHLHDLRARLSHGRAGTTVLREIGEVSLF